MAVTVTKTAISQAVTDTETQIGSTISTDGVYFFRIDLNPIAAGISPDIYEIREYMKIDGTTERMLEGSPMTYVGGLRPAAIELPQRIIDADDDYRITMKRVGGSNRTFAAALYQIE